MVSIIDEEQVECYLFNLSFKLSATRRKEEEFFVIEEDFAMAA